jgi:hypothetical protein
MVLVPNEEFIFRQRDNICRFKNHKLFSQNTYWYGTIFALVSLFRKTEKVNSRFNSISLALTLSKLVKLSSTQPGVGELGPCGYFVQSSICSYTKERGM